MCVCVCVGGGGQGHPAADNVAGVRVARQVGQRQRRVPAEEALKKSGETIENRACRRAEKEEDRLAKRRPTGQMATDWSNGGRLVKWRPTGQMATDWSNNAQARVAAPAGRPARRSRARPARACGRLGAWLGQRMVCRAAGALETGLKSDPSLQSIYS